MRKKLTISDLDGREVIAHEGGSHANCDGCGRLIVLGAEVSVRTDALGQRYVCVDCDEAEFECTHHCYERVKKSADGRRYKVVCCSHCTFRHVADAPC